jgi:hypothetical protein
LISVSLAPGSYFLSAAQAKGAGMTEAAMVASAVALNSRLVCFFIVSSLDCPQ